jgi:hypothetical protein
MQKILHVLWPNTMVACVQLGRPPSNSLLTGMAERKISDIMREDRSCH